MATNSYAFKIEKFTSHIGANIIGLDLKEKLDEDTVRALYQAWLDHIVLVFRDCNLTQEDQIRITNYFGRQAKLARPAKYYPPGYSKILPNIMLISNIRENGEPIGALPDGEMMFHHDMLHAEIPDKGTMLYSCEIPDRGGNTLFASGYAAYDTLPREIREPLEGKLAFHHYNYGSVQKGDGKGTEAYSESLHPVFRVHEETKRKAIYVNRLMTEKVEGMEPERSHDLLSAVFDHMERPEFVYTHEWRIGDLILWDNRCSAHAREDFPNGQRRLMLRTTIEGDTRPF